MKITSTFCSFLLLFSIFLHAQKNKKVVEVSDSSGLEKVVNTYRNTIKDSLVLQKHLKPLFLTQNSENTIIRQVYLAKGYALILDKENRKSEEYFKNSLALAKKIEHAGLEIWASLEYGEYLYNFRQITAALPIFLSAIEKIQAIDPSKIIFPSESYKTIGFYLGTIGDHQDAIFNLRKALLFTDQNTSEYAAILDNIGMYYLTIGEVENAEKYCSEASDLAKSIGDELRYAKTLGSLAKIEEKKGNYNVAIKLLNVDIEISENLGARQNTMYANTVLAKIYLRMNLIPEAEEALSKANEIAKTKSYFKINELDILKLKLTILQKKNLPNEELKARRRIEALEDSLNKTEGVLPLSQANWMLQKRKYQSNITTTKKQLKKELLVKNTSMITAAFLLTFLIIIIISFKKSEKKKKKIIEEQIAAYESKQAQSKKKLLEVDQNLQTQITYLKDKNTQIQNLQQEIADIKDSKSFTQAEEERKLDLLLQSHLMTDENWRNFRIEFEKEYALFYKSLHDNFPEITDSNLRVILLEKLQFTNAEIAGLLGITVEAVKKSRQRLKRKLGGKYDLLNAMIISAN
ncbi:tetratricopeptide repeat protein [Chryseobacterium sp. MP_3.2]|uniref:tetratricopeptide repeat protein n=1 Tax=Chryseobacterium sp. MP_3.2 TaxID=3071712 RepID=UPI002E050F6A|nr:tetratricopeptide (TPR) repeat protein/DNA-directed RNA polymerase specialized sigma24 family protein [Chryseobacterium sp. MP_3.2]